nr:ferric-chelate reductase [Cryptococcus depauperatus CBS 7855]
MTVTGSISAKVAASSYVPPYKATTSFAQSPDVTGSVTSALPVDPTISTGLSGAPYTTAYLEAHRMSWPSYRYVYIMWFIFAAIALLYAISHHIRLSGGSLGAIYTKWGIRRKAFGRPSNGRRGMVLPSNNIMVSIAILVAIPVALTLVGPDYVKPKLSVFNYTKRAFVPYTINKAFWTSGNRFGDMAFALIPLVVLFALKAPPFAVFCLRPFTHLFHDKLVLFHRVAAWLVWAITTVHVILWTIQLFKDQHDGKAVWFTMWHNYRFVFGCIAYGLMTALMVASLKPARKHAYEFFYIAHVILVCGTIVCSAIHHPVLWWWMAAALILWAGERAVRLVRMWHINGIFKRRSKYDALIPGKPYDDKTYHLQSLLQSNPYMSSQYGGNYVGKKLPPVITVEEGPASDFNMSRSSTMNTKDVPHSSGHGYDDDFIRPLAAYDAQNDEQSYSPMMINHEQINSISPVVHNSPAYPPIIIPLGYAQAQLLPSRTVRLTIRVARPFSWAPGQSVLLYLPEISRFQSHPFTILNNGPAEIVLLVKARKGLTKRLFELVRKRTLAAIELHAQDKRISLASLRPGIGECPMNVPPIFLKAQLDGPMGSSERVRWKEHSTVMIVCGGSGVSFGASICEYVCETIKNRIGKTQRVRFCWVVREYAEIAWVAGQLRKCQDMISADQLQIDIFVTNGKRTKDDFAPPKPVFTRAMHSRTNSYDSAASEMSTDTHTDSDEAVDATLQDSYADVIDLTNYEDEEDIDDAAENQLSSKLENQGKLRRARSRRVATGRRLVKPKAAQTQTPSYPPTQLQSQYDLPDEQHYLSTYSDRHVTHDNESNSIHDIQPTKASKSYAVSPILPEPISTQNQSMSSPRESWEPYAKRLSTKSMVESAYNSYDPFAGLAHSGRSGGHLYSPSITQSVLEDTQSFTDDSVRKFPVRDSFSQTSRTQSMVLLQNMDRGDPTGDAGFWIDEADYAAMSRLSEMARVGKPKLSIVLGEEIDLAKGSLIVATCGPVTLNTVVRNLVSKHISPSRIRHGDRRGHVVVYSEDYEG